MVCACAEVSCLVPPAKAKPATNAKVKKTLKNFFIIELLDKRWLETTERVLGYDVKIVKFWLNSAKTTANTGFLTEIS
jgi:hypothetical protein